MSKWRKRARATINRVLAQSTDRSPAETLAAIDAAYPFGPREHHPYKAWLTERAIAKERLFGTDDPMTRTCPACGAKPGKPCLSIESKASALQAELVGVLYRNEGEMHAARIQKGRP